MPFTSLLPFRGEGAINLLFVGLLFGGPDSVVSYRLGVESGMMQL